MLETSAARDQGDLEINDSDKVKDVPSDESEPLIGIMEKLLLAL